MTNQELRFRRVVGSRSHGAATAFLVAVALCCGGSPALVAQDEVPVIDVVEDLDFDQPQSWALKYFGSVALLTPLGPPRAAEAGSVDLALEVTQVPHLSADERRVGFNGFKEEDLNRLPVIVRPRIAFGLPHRFGIELGYVPPIRVDGIEPNLVSLAVDHELHGGERWSVGARLHGQMGEVEGDLTCSEEDASFEPGTPENSFGCGAPSNDEATLDHYGVRVGAGYRYGGDRGPTLLFGAGAIHHDLEFQVDAITFDEHDRTLLRTDGTTWALDAGISIAASERAQLGFELLYSPLEVVRPPSTTEQNDDLLHVKALLRYRVN